MASRPRTLPRKTPRQERARVTVDAIVKATARILVKNGYESATTNAVAKAAGVSVGSLYQYFPSKEALVVAVMDQHFDHMLTTLQARLLALVNEPIDVVAPALVNELVDMHRMDPQLHKVLIEQVPRVGKLAKMNELDNRLCQLVAMYLTTHKSEVDVEDVELASFMIIKAGEALCHAALTERPELLHNGRISREITRMILSYVRPQPAARTLRTLRTVKSGSR